MKNNLTRLLILMLAAVSLNTSADNDHLVTNKCSRQISEKKTELPCCIKSAAGQERPFTPSNFLFFY